MGSMIMILFGDDNEQIDVPTKEQIETIRENHPYLTFIPLKAEPYWRCGVASMAEKKGIFLYDCGRIHEKKLLPEFLSYANAWWWHSTEKRPPFEVFILDNIYTFNQCSVIIPSRSMDGPPIGPVYDVVADYKNRITIDRIEIL